MLSRCVLIVFTGLTAFAVPKALAEDAFTRDVQPFLARYCAKCHNSEESRGELDLSTYQRESDVTRHFRRWGNIIGFIRNGEMPPEDADLQPTLDERNSVIESVESTLHAEAMKHAGDPGVVLPRRLSNTEYDQSIRDLTGIDIRPAKEFPADPAGGEGFNNTGEALGMSPSLLRKYLQAAQHVSQHLVLQPSEITFVEKPVTSYNERKKLTEQAIIEFYRRHDVRLRDYLEAAWRYRYRSGSNRDIPVSMWAERSELSGKYLNLVLTTLNEAASGFGYVRRVGELWDALPAPQKDRAAPAELKELDRFIEFCRQRLNHREGQLIKPGAGNWPIQHLDFRAKTAAMRDRFDPARFESKTLVRFDRLRAAKSDSAMTMTVFLRVDPAFANAEGSHVLVHRPLFSQSGNLPRNEAEEEKHEVVSLRMLLEKHAPEVATHLAFGTHPLGHSIDEDSFVVTAPSLIEIPISADMLAEVDGKHLLAKCELDPQHSRQGSVHLQHSMNQPLNDPYANHVELLVHQDADVVTRMATSAEAFCRAFPNRFFYVDRNRGLAAGFHLVEGFFRDDQPLVANVLSDQEDQELDRLWEELHFVTSSVETLLRGFVWFERSERHVLHDKRFDFLRAEDPKLVEDELLTRFERTYLDKMGVRLVEGTLEPESPNERFELIHGFFEGIRKGLARHRELLVEAEQSGFRDLTALAQRAYHRPLEARDEQSLRKLYRTLRSQGQGVEDALRNVLIAILMSPDFSYRYADTNSGTDIAPLPDNALAARLSYFLWSSLPDQELLTVASSGSLQNEAELLRQTRRMMNDPRLENFCREFFGQWLRYRDYLTNDSINADTFPGYTEELRQAMFEEPTRLTTFLIRNDRPIIELLTSDTTFVNDELAKHYGGHIVERYLRARQLDDSLQSAQTEPNSWRQVDGLRAAGRGGLFGMGVVLTKNSAGERTSPVKRGFWTVHHLLGQHFPPPPADVPELPKNEKESTQTIRKLLAAHTKNPRCAMCHVHFDALGLAMEGFDPIGRSRTKDLAGRVIDNVAELPNGKTASGVSGLIDYVEQHRRDDFVRTLCRKFLGYALGRSVILSDQPLLLKMESALQNGGYRFSILFETVVTSPQFRNQRRQDYVSQRP